MSTETNNKATSSNQKVVYHSAGSPANTRATVYYGPYLVTRVARTINSVKTPNYRTRKVKGNLPINPYSLVLQTDRYAYGGVYTSPLTSAAAISANYGDTTGPFQATLTGFTNPGPDLLGARITSLSNEVTSRVLADLKNQKVNLAQVFAERSQTYRLFLETAQAVEKSLLALRRGNFVLACSHLGVLPHKRKKRRFNKAYERDRQRGPISSQSDSLSAGWLSLQYGWKPLLQDLYGTCEFMADRQTQPVRGRVSVRRTTKADAFTNVTDTTYPGVPIHVSRTHLFSKTTTVYYQTSSPQLQTLSSVGITNPALLAWELLPFSFVADWFIPIGSYLSNLDASLGLTFTKGSTTTFERKTTTAVQRGKQATASLVTMVDLTQSGEWLSVNRTVLTSFPTVVLPSFKSPFSQTHIANAVALIIQRVK